MAAGWRECDNTNADCWGSSGASDHLRTAGSGGHSADPPIVKLQRVMLQLCTGERHWIWGLHARPTAIGQCALQQAPHAIGAKQLHLAALQINRPDKRPLLTSVQAQTAFLLGVASAAAQAQLPVAILAVDASTWSSNADSTGWESHGGS